MKNKIANRLLSCALALVMVLTLLPGVTAHAENEVATTIFAQGAGTGIEFNSSSWNFNGAYRTDSGLNYLNASTAYKTGIKTNQYSGNDENVIRLIDGVAARQGAHSYASGFRSGSAFIKSGIDLDADCSFSAKFTISMPGAVVDEDGVYTRAPGGDGIAFVLQPSANPVGKAGGGLGYEEIDDSLAIELDSFFNGAYYAAASTGGYGNWGYDNQVYNYSDSGENSGNMGAENYTGIPANRRQRFDHIGVLMDGNPLEHKAIYYLAGLDPTATNSGNYINLNSNITDLAGKTDPAEIPNALQRFSDYVDGSTNNNIVKEVNNRLFTVWVEYDGVDSKNLEVRIALGDFKTAQRPASAQITYNIPDLATIFNDSDTVYLGFTSAIGSSKANHTVHSVEFINRYYSDGVPTSSTYQVEYYLEGDNGYELQTGDILTSQNGTVGDTVTAPSKTYSGYTETTTTNTVKSSVVAADGSTVLKVYYTLDPAVSSVTPGGTGAALSGSIAVTFNKKMDTSVGALSLNGTALTETGVWSNSDKTYTIPYPSLAYSTAYTIGISGFRDAAGNVMVSDNSNGFTTAAAPSSGGGGSYIPQTPSHGFTGGSTYTLGSGLDLVHTTQKNFSYFSGVRMDGENLTRNTDYTTESGSTVVTLFPSYLNTLSVGKHTLTVAFTDGVTVTAEFTVEAWINPFEDVNASDWFYGDVEYAHLRGLMTGTNGNLFSPGTPITRGMIVTILYRLEGEPDVSGLEKPFDDVAADKYYADAVKWAADNGIVTGYGGRFSPEDDITRQDLAVILWRYMDYSKIEYIVTEEYRFFADEDAIAPYAKNAVQILNKLNILRGKGGSIIDPLGTATRAEAAAMLHRFLGAGSGK